jgi:transcriptional regulator with XRE-family HTH domain
MVDREAQLDSEWRAARENFRGWLQWYLRNYPNKWPTQRALAEELGITEGRLSQFLAADPTEPKLKVLLAAKRAFQSSIDHLLTPPPGSPTEGR